MDFLFADVRNSSFSVTINFDFSLISLGVANSYIYSLRFNQKIFEDLESLLANYHLLMSQKSQRIVEQQTPSFPDWYIRLCFFLRLGCSRFDDSNHIWIDYLFATTSLCISRIRHLMRVILNSIKIHRLVSIFSFRKRDLKAAKKFYHSSCSGEGIFLFDDFLSEKDRM